MTDFAPLDAERDHLSELVVAARQSKEKTVWHPGRSRPFDWKYREEEAGNAVAAVVKQAIRCAVLGAFAESRWELSCQVQEHFDATEEILKVHFRSDADRRWEAANTLALSPQYSKHWYAGPSNLTHSLNKTGPSVEFDDIDACKLASACKKLADDLEALLDDTFPIFSSCERDGQVIAASAAATEATNQLKRKRLASPFEVEDEDEETADDSATERCSLPPTSPAPKRPRIRPHPPREGGPRRKLFAASSDAEGEEVLILFDDDGNEYRALLV